MSNMVVLPSRRYVSLMKYANWRTVNEVTETTILELKNAYCNTEDGIGGISERSTRDTKIGVLTATVRRKFRDPNLHFVEPVLVDDVPTFETITDESVAVKKSVNMFLRICKEDGCVNQRAVRDGCCMYCEKHGGKRESIWDFMDADKANNV